jgi:hypothetical protein
MGGGFVVAGHIPPFVEGYEPDVLVWGERFFKANLNDDGNAIVDQDGALLYTEAFAVALVIIDEARTS